MIKKTIPLLFILFLCSFNSFSQSGILKGFLHDTIQDAKIPRATVTLIRHSDSIMVGFTRTNTNGEFTFPKVKQGKYVILISHPMYAGYSDVVEVGATLQTDLGSIQLLSEEMLLKELTVLSSAGIKIKGDTIEYTADSFKVKENANVEDLLKKLPGIQVNKNGEITAQGKRVEKVLVDGDEFFSDDPTVATQNLKAESVDKVQVYEKKDEISGSTDQGTQTINITLKEDAKKGYFGKLTGGIGSDDVPTTFYNNEFMINRFKPKERYSAYLIHSNIGKTNLNWRENQNFGEDDGSRSSMWEDGFVFMFSQEESDDEFQSGGGRGGGGGFNGAGIPEAINGGATFSNKWNNKKHHIGGSYQFKQVENLAITSTTTESFLQDTTFLKEEESRNFTKNQRHNLSLFYDFKIDSLTSIKFNLKGNSNSTDKNNNYSSTTLNEAGTKVNKNDRITNSESDITNFNGSANFLKKFKNPEQKLNIVLSYTNRLTKSESFLNSDNQLFAAYDSLLFRDTTDQHKTIDKLEQSGKANVTYMQPISKTSVLEFRYAFFMQNQTADRYTFDKTNASEYTELLDSLSSEYVYDYSSHRGGINFNYKKDKVSFKFGADVSNQIMSQVDNLNNTSLGRNFINYFPNASFVYSVNKMKQLRINYNGNTKQPTINQVQPLIDNSDPFNIIVGNPDLKPGFVNNFNISFNNSQVMKGRYLWSFVNLTHRMNEVVTSSYVDAFNRNITEFVNATGMISAFGTVGEYVELKKIDGSINVNLNGNFNRGISFINDEKNITENTNFNGEVRMDKDFKDEIFNIGINYNYGYNLASSSIQESANINYWTQEAGIDMELVIKKRFIIGTDFNASLRQKTETFQQNNDVYIWNAGMSYKFFKNQNGILTFNVNDILNQNLGFQRNASAYSIIESRYNVIKRYFMLSFTWEFNSNKTKKVEDEW